MIRVVKIGREMGCGKFHFLSIFVIYERNDGAICYGAGRWLPVFIDVCIDAVWKAVNYRKEMQNIPLERERENQGKEQDQQVCTIWQNGPDIFAENEKKNNQHQEKKILGEGLASGQRNAISKTTAFFYFSGKKRIGSKE